MKRILFSALYLLVFACCVYGQGVRKYITIEQISNSRCPICANRIPQFRNNISPYADEIHLIGYYAPVPYATCPYYLSNSQGNLARTTYYQVQGTPSVQVNGVNVNIGSGIVPTTYLESIAGQISPLEIRVTESGQSSRNVSVTIKAHEQIAAGNYRLYATVVEANVTGGPLPSYQQHHNVFRRFLHDNAGELVTLPAAGDSLTLNYSYQTDPSWQANEVYVIVFVQNNDNREILNSGSSRDQLSSSGETISLPVLDIYPNPAADRLEIRLPLSGQGAELRVVSGSGVEFIREQLAAPGGSVHSLDTGSWAPGLYIIRLTDRAGNIYQNKILRQ